MQFQLRVVRAVLENLGPSGREPGGAMGPAWAGEAVQEEEFIQVKNREKSMAMLP